MFFNKKILLHIGYPKCLSTYLQKNIFPNICKLKNIDYINKKQSLNKFRDLFESIHKKKVVEKKFINNFENKTLFSHEGLINFEESYNPNNPKLLFDYFSNNALILIVIKKPSDLYKSNFIQKFMELKFLNFNDYQNHTDHRKFNIFKDIKSYSYYFNNIVVVKQETLLDNYDFYKNLFELSNQEFLQIVKDKVIKNKSFSNYAIKFTLKIDKFLNIFGYSIQKYDLFIRSVHTKSTSPLMKKITKYLIWRFLIQDIFDKFFSRKKYELKIDINLKAYFNNLDIEYEKFPSYLHIMK